MTALETVSLSTSDGVALEGEISSAPDPRARAVLCHPHPEFGGTMRSIVISTLFEALPAAGVSCLRFNFRGVEGSEGTHDGGRGERDDALAAVSRCASLHPSAPLVLVGWSFGADIALSVDDSRVAGWIACAPPLRFATSWSGVAGDERPKWLILAEHDEFQEPETIRDRVSDWTHTTITVVPGASHFFVGRTDRVVEGALGAIDTLVSMPT